MVLRFARDVGTHRRVGFGSSFCFVCHPHATDVRSLRRSLCLIRRDFPPAGGLLIKVPYNPAAEAYVDTFVHLPAPAFAGNNLAFSLVTCHSGFVEITAAQFADGVKDVAAAVYTGFRDVVDLCRPPA